MCNTCKKCYHVYSESHKYRPQTLRNRPYERSYIRNYKKLTSWDYACCSRELHFIHFILFLLSPKIVQIGPLDQKEKCKM